MYENSQNSSLTLKRSPLHSDLSLLDHCLYISSTKNSTKSVLCYDDVLCYLSNVIGHGSREEIQSNLKRYFTDEQLEKAFSNLKDSIGYSLNSLRQNNTSDQSISLLQCLDNLTHESSLLSTMEKIERFRLTPLLPTFVTNDWLSMIRNIQDLEKIDSPSSSKEIKCESPSQVKTVKEQLSSLNELLESIRRFSLTSFCEPVNSLNDQCCLRSNCSHGQNLRFTSSFDSPTSSSRSSLELERPQINTIRQVVPRFIRNPVSNFLMPMTPVNRKEIGLSDTSVDDTSSGDDEYRTNGKISSFVVVRDADLWIYPAGLEQKKSDKKREYHRSQSMFTAIVDNPSKKPIFSRGKSFDDDDLSRDDEQIGTVHLKKHRKEKG